MTRRAKVAAVALVLLLRATSAAEPAPAPQHVETSEPRLLCVPPARTARCIDLVPGHFVDRGTWDKIDLAIRQAQDGVTRLTAENVSLRASASGWQPGWYTLLGVVAGGIALGWWAHDKL